MCTLPRRLTLLAVILTLSTAASAFEVGALFNLSNLDFARSRVSSETTLPGDDYLWGVTITGHDELSDALALDLSFSTDPILRRIAYTRLQYIDDYFSIAVGPFFGVLNSPESIVQSGLSTTVELYIPGFTFVRLRSDNSLSGRLVVTGDYIQERSELAVGFYTPNAIPTLFVRNKRYTAKTDPGETVDSLTEYGLSTDIFQKNIPYRVVLTMAYQDAARQYVEATAVNHSFSSVVLGALLSLELFDAVTLRADLESSIYTFGRDYLLGEVSADRFLFRLYTGVVLDASALTRRR